MNIFPYDVGNPPMHGQLFFNEFNFGVPPTPPGSNALLQENSDFLLLESGDKILLET